MHTWVTPLQARAMILQTATERDDAMLPCSLRSSQRPRVDRSSFVLHLCPKKVTDNHMQTMHGEFHRWHLSGAHLLPKHSIKLASERMTSARHRR
jgi:hypothetical protein